MTTSIPQRELGKTGVKVSVLGLGGHHLGDAPMDVAIDVVHAAIDAGVTFFDNCWEYHNGMSEVVLGKALAGKRDKVFSRTRRPARTGVESRSVLTEERGDLERYL